MRLTIRVKLISGATLILIAMVIVGWRGIAGMRDINKELNSINSDQFEPARVIANANIGLIAWNHATLNHVLAESIQKMDEYERIMLEQKTTILERLQTLSELDQLSVKGKELVRKLLDNFSNADPIRDRVVMLSRAEKQEEGRYLVRMELRSIIDHMDADMTEFLRLQERQLDDILKATDERYIQGLTRISLIIGIAVVASLLIFFFLSTAVMKNVNELVRGAKLAAEGDFTQAKVTLPLNNELSYLGAVFNMMLDRLEENLKERKRVEEALQESNERLSAFMESAPDSFVLYDSELNLVEINKVGLELFPTETKKEDIIGKNMTELAPGIEETDRYDRYLEVLETGESFFTTDFVPHPKFGDIHLTVKAFKVGKNLGLIVTDITKRKQSEEALELAVQEAEEANRAKSNFLSNMSHELRTPLNAVIGFSEVLRDRYFGELNEKQADYVNDILESGKHLLSLINDILDLSKVEAGKMEFELSQVNIKDLLDSSLVMIKEKAHKHRIGLDLKVQEEMSELKIQADERKLKQVMFNLLSNAAKFTPDGGEIRVTADLISDLGCRISELTKEEKQSAILDPKSKIEISVADTGIGIAPEDHEKIFDEFYQVKGGIKDKTPGTGLGLPLTKSLVKIHGGRIWVESDGKGKGSRFSFTLPIRI